MVLDYAVAFLITNPFFLSHSQRFCRLLENTCSTQLSLKMYLQSKIACLPISWGWEINKFKEKKMWATNGSERRNVGQRRKARDSKP